MQHSESEMRDGHGPHHQAPGAEHFDAPQTLSGEPVDEDQGERGACQEEDPEPRRESRPGNNRGADDDYAGKADQPEDRIGEDKDCGLRRVEDGATGEHRVESAGGDVIRVLGHGELLHQQHGGKDQPGRSENNHEDAVEAVTKWVARSTGGPGSSRRGYEFLLERGVRSWPAAAIRRIWARTDSRQTANGSFSLHAVGLTASTALILTSTPHCPESRHAPEHNQGHLNQRTVARGEADGTPQW